MHESTHFIGIQPRRSKFLERSLRAPSDGDSSALENFNPRIDNRSLDRAQIWRWRDPFDARAFEELIAMPVSHGDDVQLGADVILRVKKLPYFLDCHRVPTRQRQLP